MASDRVPILVHWGGKVVASANTPSYKGGQSKIMAIRRDVTYKGLEEEIHKLTSYHRSEYRLHISFRCPIGAEYELVELIDDDSIRGMMCLYPQCQCLKVFVEINACRSQNPELFDCFTSLLPCDVSLGGMTSSGTMGNSDIVAEVNGATSPPSVQDTPATLLCTIPNARGSLMDDNGYNGDISGRKGSIILTKDNLEDYCKSIPAIESEGHDIRTITVANNSDVELFDEEPKFMDDLSLCMGDDTCEDSSQAVVVYGAGGEVHEDQSPDRDISTWVGMIFSSKQSLIKALQQWHIGQGLQMRVVRSAKSIYEARCMVPTCRWRLLATKPKGRNYFIVRKCKESHSCDKLVVQDKNKNCTTKVVCQLILPVMKAKLSMTPTEIIARVQKDLLITISYSKAWLARNAAFKIIYGSWEQSFSDLPQYLTMVQHANPGTIWSMFPQWPQNGVTTFQRVFWAFGPSIHGFGSCRPLISIDSIPLFGKYTSQALIAAGVDADDRVYPLAFAVCHGENCSSWDWAWFLELLKDYVVPARRPVCIISNQFSSNIETVRRYFPPSEGHSHRWCLQHIKASMKEQFNDENLVNLFIKIGHASSETEYYKLTADLQSLSSDAYHWVHSLHPFREYWVKAFDGGRRFGWMTTNISAILDGISKGVRGLPITAFVAATFYKCKQYFVTRRRDGMAMGTLITPSIDAELQKRVADARRYQVAPLSANEFKVYVGDKAHYKVTINGHITMCLCAEYHLTGIPCTHILAVCCTSEMDINCQTLCSQWYTSEAFHRSYAPLFHPVQDRKYWPRPRGPPVQPPPLKRRKGRPQSKSTTTVTGDKGVKRRKNRLTDEKGVKHRKCKLCKEEGHYMSTCPQNRVDPTQQ